jgi:nucleotide-binding universal stress UspA family protein
MVTIGRILCPVDFSDFSRLALDYAVALARWYGSRLTVLHVHHALVPAAAQLAPFAPVEPIVVAASDLEHIRRRLAAYVPAEAQARLPLEATAVEGDPAREILAEAVSADMIVMGTHGRSGFERLVLGSVTEKVLRRATCSVVTIPVCAPPAAETVPVLFRRIVAAVDFSDVSMYALRHAASLAVEVDAHLTVMHVIEAPERLALWIDRDDATSRVREWTKAAQRRLRSAVSDELREYAQVVQRVETGCAYREILRVADDQQADLIVIGAHGHGVVDTMFVGSTAQHVVRTAVCPVLTVRRRADREGHC